MPVGTVAPVTLSLTARSAAHALAITSVAGRLKPAATDSAGATADHHRSWAALPALDHFPDLALGWVNSHEHSRVSFE